MSQRLIKSLRILEGDNWWRRRYPIACPDHDRRCGMSRAHCIQCFRSFSFWYPVLIKYRTSHVFLSLNSNMMGPLAFQAVVRFSMCASLFAALYTSSVLPDVLPQIDLSFHSILCLAISILTVRPFYWTARCRKHLLTVSQVTTGPTLQFWFLDERPRK
jgi:hypothetical protein